MIRCGGVDFQKRKAEDFASPPAFLVKFKNDSEEGFLDLLI